jgi:type 2 lantibiotic biosynthesis protein LanM
VESLFDSAANGMPHVDCAACPELYDDVATPNSTIEAFSAPHLAWASDSFYARSAAFGLPRALQAAMQTNLAAYLKQRFDIMAGPSLALAYHAWLLRAPGTISPAAEFRARLTRGMTRSDILRYTPLLDRAAAIVTEQTINAFIELADRALSDAIELEDRFDVDLSKIVSVTFGLGDPHKSGRTVALLRTDTGSAIYKPRSLASEDLFYGFLRWLSPKLRIPFRTLKISDHDQYGWMEFASVIDCKNAEEVNAAFYRVGALLASCHVLGVHDVHYENLLVSGAHPFLIDLETILGACEKDVAQGYRSTRIEVFHQSLMKIGFLPQPTVVGVDMSAAGLTRTQRVRNRGRKFSDGADGPAIVETDVELAPAANLPRLNGVIQSPKRYRHIFECGFREAYNAILGARAELLAADWLWTGVDNVQPRWIPRPTQIYADLLRKLRHPSSLRSTESFANVLASIHQQHIDGFRSTDFRVAEFAQLLQFDIPIFHSAPRHRDVLVGRRQIAQGMFRRSGAEEVKSRVESLSQDDLLRQLNVIRLAFKSAGVRRPVRSPRRIPAVPRHIDWLQEAVELAEVVDNLGFKVDDQVVYIDLVVLGRKAQIAAPITTNFYNGISGVGFAFGYFGAVSSDKRYRELARRCLRALLDSTEANIPSGVGVFDGPMGVVLSLIHISKCLDLREPADEISRLLTITSERLDTDQTLDLLGGSAGVVLASLSLAARGAETASKLRSLAVRAAERLRQTVKIMPAGACWPCNGHPHPLTGLSHGTSGIGLALATYGNAFGEDWAMAMAAEALRFERPTFDRRRGLWADLRRRGTFPTAWCHGAPGMTLARQRMFELGLEPYYSDIREEIDLGMKATANSLSGTSLSLCHGLAGNLEPLLEDSKYAATVNQAEMRLVTLGRQHVRSRDSLSPGFMTGLSGIMYAFLRRAVPSLPNMLTLQCDTAWCESAPRRIAK